MAVTWADVLEVIDELIEALTGYQNRTERDVELILRPDGTATLMVGMEFEPRPATGFEVIAEFDSIADLWVFPADGRGGGSMRPYVPRTKAETPLGAAIRSVRLARGETVKAFAERIGTSHPALCRWESGKERPSFLMLLNVGEIAPRPLRELIVEELGKMVRRDGLKAMLAEVAGRRAGGGV
jgi:DNA-binding XRE family transcriptional regulator